MNPIWSMARPAATGAVRLAIENPRPSSPKAAGRSLGGASSPARRWKASTMVLCAMPAKMAITNSTGSSRHADPNPTITASVAVLSSKGSLAPRVSMMRPVGTDVNAATTANIAPSSPTMTGEAGRRTAYSSTVKRAAM